MSDGRDAAERKAGKWLVIFAIVFAFILVIFTGYQRTRQTSILANESWCGRAIQAEKLAGERKDTSCGDLLRVQLKAVALNSHIDAVGHQIALLSLMIMVLAGGNLALNISKAGATIGLGRKEQQAVAVAAKETAAAAEDKADTIAKGAFTPPPGESL